MPELEIKLSPLVKDQHLYIQKQQFFLYIHKLQISV